MCKVGGLNETASLLSIQLAAEENVFPAGHRQDFLLERIVNRGEVW